jgi:transcriptional regulator with XRE-family HTH domain
MSLETGKIIKTRLQDLKKKQAWLAEKAGVSINAVSKWTKTGKLAREHVQAVADALEISADELLAGTPILELVPAGDTTIERLNANEKHLLELYRRSTDVGKMGVIGMAESVPKLPARSLRRPN